jgi:hypothetical protein
MIQHESHEARNLGRCASVTTRHVVSLPAEAQPNDPLGRKPGEMLWDDAYGYGNFLRSEKATQTPRNWSALYQQAPGTGSRDADDLWRLRLRRHRGWW